MPGEPPRKPPASVRRQRRGDHPGAAGRQSRRGQAAVRWWPGDGDGRRRGNAAARAQVGRARPRAPAPTPPSRPATCPWSAATCSPSRTLSRRTLATIKSNLFWTFGDNTAVIPLTALEFLNPPIARPRWRPAPSSWSPAACGCAGPGPPRTTRSCLPEVPDERWPACGLAHEAGAEQAQVSRHGTPSRRGPAGCRCRATGTLPVCLPTRRGRAVSPPGLSRARTFTGFARLRPGTGEASPCIGSPVARTEFSVGDDERPLPMGQPTVRLPGRCPGR